MTVMVQIRNVPEALHRELTSRAALAGMSLSDYLLGEIQQVAARPTLGQMRARLAQRPEVSLSVAVREGAAGKLYLAYLRDPDGNKLCALHRM